jgi:hypothetical protein
MKQNSWGAGELQLLLHAQMPWPEALQNSKQTQIFGTLD